MTELLFGVIINMLNMSIMIIVKQNKLKILESSLEESVYRLVSNGDFFMPSEPDAAEHSNTERHPEPTSEYPCR